MNHLEGADGGTGKAAILTGQRIGSGHQWVQCDLLATANISMSFAGLCVETWQNVVAIRIRAVCGAIIILVESGVACPRLVAVCGSSTVGVFTIRQTVGVVILSIMT